MKIIIRQGSESEVRLVGERIQQNQYQKEIVYRDKSWGANAIIDDVDFTGDGQPNLLKIDGKGWSRILQFTFTDKFQKTHKFSSAGLVYDASIKIYVDDFDADSDNDIIVKTSIGIFIVENLTVRTEKYTDEIFLVDKNNDFRPNQGETCYISQSDKKYAYLVDQVTTNGFYVLKNVVESGETNAMPTLVYSPRHRGFLFQRQDDEGNDLVAVSGNSLFDISDYRLKLVTTDPHVLYEEIADQLALNTDELALIPSYLSLQRYSEINFLRKQEIEDLIQKEQKLIDFLGVEDVQELVDMLVTEGEYFFMSPELENDSAFPLTFANVSARYILGKIHININGISERIKKGRAGIGSIIGILVHEYYHHQDPRSSLYEGWEKNHELPTQFTLPFDDPQIAWIYRKLTQIIIHCPQIGMVANGIFFELQDQGYQDEDLVYRSTHALLYLALIEASAYLETLRYIEYVCGFENYKQHFDAKDVSDGILSTIEYLSVCSLFLISEDGEEVIADILKFLKEHPKIVWALKNIFEQMRDQEREFYLTNKPHLESLWSKIEEI